MSRRVVERRRLEDDGDDDNDPDVAAMADATHSDDLAEKGKNNADDKAKDTNNDDDDNDDDNDKNDEKPKENRRRRRGEKEKKKSEPLPPSSSSADAPVPQAAQACHLDDLIVCASEPVPASHVCSDEVLLRDLVADRDAPLIDARRVLRDELVRGVFRYTVLQVALPASLFHEGDAGRVDDAAFKTSDPTSELHALAFDDSGRQRKLSPEQLAQLSRSGSFTVRSQLYPQLEHEWRVSAMLVHGTANIVDDWRHTVAVSADQLLRQLPRRFAGSDFSVAAGVVAIALGLFETVALLFGFIERHRQFDDTSAVGGLRQLYCLLQLRASGKALPNVHYTYDGDVSLYKKDKNNGDNDDNDVDDAAAESNADGGAAAVAAPRRRSSKNEKHERDEMPRIDEAQPLAHWPAEFQANDALDTFHLDRHRAKKLAEARAAGDVSLPVPSANARTNWLWRDSNRESIVALDDAAVLIERLPWSHSKVERIVQKLVAELDAEWTDRHADELTKAIRAVAAELGVDADAALKGTDKELVRTLSAPVATAVAKTYNAELLARVAASSELAKLHARMPALVCDVLRAQWIVAQNQADYARIAGIREQLELKRVQAARSIMSLVGGWLQEHMDAYRTRLDAALSRERTAATIAELKAAGLRNDAYLLERAVAYDAQVEARDRAHLRTFTVPERVFEMRVRIWSSSNWHITKNHKTYSCNKWDTWSVTSGNVGWRWWLFVVMLVAYLKNILFFLIVGLVAGPLSIRALVSPSPFYPDRDVDPETGAIVTVRSTKIWSFPALLASLWRNVLRQRADFERRPDTGLIGKGVTRIFNVVWWYLFYGLFGTLLLFAVLPAAIVINCALCLVLIFTALAWWPVALLVGFLFALLVYDWLHARYGVRWFPLFSALLGRIVFLGVFRIALSVVAALVVHPLVALFCFVFACLRAGLRWFWDKLMMLLVLRRRGRVPAANEFLTRRVRGPGITFQCAFQLPTQSALIALRSSLEALELQELERRVDWIETAPQVWLQRALQRAVRGVLASFSATENLVGAVRGTREMLDMRAAFRRALGKRRQCLPGTSVNGRELRQTADDLSNTVTLAEQIVEQFVRSRILQALQQRCPHVPVDMPNDAQHTAQAFWKRKSVKEGDFKALTAQLLSGALGARFLEPLEESDRVIQLEAKDTRVSHIVKDVMSGVVSPPLRVNTYVYTEQELPYETDETRIVQRIRQTSLPNVWLDALNV